MTTSLGRLRVLDKLLGARRASIGIVLIIGSGIVFGVIGFCKIDAVSADCPRLSLNAQFAGLANAGAQKALADGCGSLKLAIGWDWLLMFGYLVVTTGLIVIGWWRYDAPQLKALARYVPFLPLAVFSVDAAENVVTVLSTGGGTQISLLGERPLASRLITTLATAKWLLIFILAIVVLMSFVVWLSRWGKVLPENERESTAEEGRRETTGDEDRIDTFIDLMKVRAGETFNKAPPTSVDLGLAASGGGIRATAFTLGALEEFERTEVINDVRRITAVSGGSWGATAWVMERAALEDGQGTPTDVARTVIDRLLAAPTAPKVKNCFVSLRAVAERLIARLRCVNGQRDGAGHQDRPWAAPVRYLLNGPGGLLWPLLFVIGCAVTTLVLLVAMTYSLSWVAGYVLGQSFLFADIRSPSSIPLTWDNPGTFMACAGLVLLIVAAFTHWIAKVWRPLAAVVGLGVAAYVFTGLVPALFWLFDEGQVVKRLQATWASLLGIVGLSSIGAQIWRFFGSDIQSRATRFITAQLPKLLGVLLALVAVVGGLFVAYHAAFNPAAATKAQWVMVFILIVFYFLVGPNRPSINQIFSKRLQRSFAPMRRTGEGGSDFNAGTWEWLKGMKAVPELVICCAQQRNGLAAGGLPAESLTISPIWVTRGYEREETSDYFDRVGKVKWHLGRPYPHLNSVAPWMAISGAAFSSAMGRNSLGSTNAALAAVNADLGVWIPTVAPRSGNSSHSRPRTAYILKEVLGWYSPEDAYVFVTDGGHWENLGLVEQLRSSCRTIICLDASGDTPGSFTTLRESIDLAQLELQAKIAVPDLEAALEPLKAIGSQLPKTVATRIPFTVDTGTDPQITGTIYYAKLQISADMNKKLRLFAKEDPKFPTYSTLNQFLSDRQFAALVTAGNHAGERVATLYREDQRSRVRVEAAGES